MPPAKSGLTEAPAEGQVWVGYEGYKAGGREATEWRGRHFGHREMHVPKPGVQREPWGSETHRGFNRPELRAR